MTKLRFDPQDQALILDVILEGKITIHTRMVLDTGASFIVIPLRIAKELGLNIDPKKIIKTTTATTVESVPVSKIPKVTVLGKSSKKVDCLIKDLPPKVKIDGLLGLSFLRNFYLSLDFKKGVLQLE